MVASATIAAKRPSPDGIELLGEWVYEGGVIGQDAILKVALALGLCAQPRSGEVGAAKVRLYAINNDALEMNARTKHPLGLLRPLRGSFASLIRPT